ncbi:hypothetical protein PQX77_021312 [Marasmius sp. AFHP31]|nr:hypothetical protein PQX77_021312 [Marasmius sp. AFHP31]
MSNHSSSPKTKTTTRFKTHTQTTTEHTPNKETPSRTTRPTAPQSPAASQEDSDDPDNDATIIFASDTEVGSAPSSPTTSQVSVTVAAPPPRSSRSTLSRSVPSTSPETSGQSDLHAYYQSRYPGKVPAPNEIKYPKKREAKYYVVTVGLEVGIFADWLVASGFVFGVSGARHKSFRDYSDAWAMYEQAYTSKTIRMLR